jgi:hypothetical protein|tara:strand:+ start:237 stop:419 length:183 start_codon:yes stop_codon:yes gene_type:complete
MIGEHLEFRSPSQADGENSGSTKKREKKANAKTTEKRNTRNGGVNNLDYKKLIDGKPQDG